MRGGVHGVHPPQDGGEQGGLLAARAGADLDDDVFLVVRVFGQQLYAQLLRQPVDLCFGFGQLLPGQLVQLPFAAVVKQGLRLALLLLCRQQRLTGVGDRRERRVLPRDLCIADGIGRGGRVGQPGRQFFVLPQQIEAALLLGIMRHVSRSPAPEAPRPGGWP